MLIIQNIACEYHHKHFKFTIIEDVEKLGERAQKTSKLRANSDVSATLQAVEELLRCRISFHVFNMYRGR